MLHAVLRTSWRGGSRSFSDSPGIPLSIASVCIWGSNTGVGKTLFSAGLADAARRSGTPFLYLKPVQTGFPADSDARLVASVLKEKEWYGPHAAHLLGKNNDSPCQPDTPPDDHRISGAARTLFAWSDAVGPHVAVEAEGRPVSDEEIVQSVAQHLSVFASQETPGNSGAWLPMAVVETAGGVSSPAPSGTLQSDVMRSLRLPALLIGDGQLGGISATLCAMDALLLRGHVVPAIALMDSNLRNARAIQRHAPKGTVVLSFPTCRPPPDAQSTGTKFSLDENFVSWLAESAEPFDHLLRAIQKAHRDRLLALESARSRAHAVFWWPFTQHGASSNNNNNTRAQKTPHVAVVDARAGERFVVFDDDDAQPYKKLQYQYDACGSWWTQGMNEHASTEMARTVGHAAARYGHIIFPQTAHEPALKLAEAVLRDLGAGWASRVFFSDDGSTAIEVALKMAFRKFMIDHGVLDDDTGLELEVLGVEGGYHGDTLGAMDAVAPSLFNGRLQTPWYTGRGLFIEPPTIGLEKGEWKVTLPPSLSAHGSPGDELLRFVDYASIFSNRQRLTGVYSQYIHSAVDAHMDSRPGVKLGACIMEPVLQGAGGMRFIDPAFQRAMAAVCSSRGIPLIADEVFSGTWRLGAPTAALLLGITPDIACYAKLLTGGMVPMAVTVTSDAVFQAFAGDTKAYALLHGHSYTAHPIGCAAAVQALESYQNPVLNPNLCTPHLPRRCQGKGLLDGRKTGCGEACGRLAPMWHPDKLAALSHHPMVKRIVALGTVVGAEIKSRSGCTEGYSSNAANDVVDGLRRRGVYARPLGDVAYVMVTPMTKRETCEELLDALNGALDELLP